MSDFDFGHHFLYPHSTRQLVRFGPRMITSRRASAISSLNHHHHTQTSHPCDSAFNAPLTSHVEDDDQGGVPLTSSTSVDNHNPHRLSSREPWTTDSSTIQSGRVSITTHADFDESHLRQHVNPYDRPPGHFVNNEYMTAPFHQLQAVAVSAWPYPHSTERPIHVTSSSHVPNQPTRWQSTSSHHSPQPTRELHHDASAWVDYDVADFLDHWHIQYHMGDAGLLHVNQQRKSQWHQPSDQASSGKYDLQRLDWAALETHRSRARLARKMLYPLRYSWTLPATYDDYSPCRQQRMYAPRGFLPHHKASHSHGQLRNVLAARSRNDIFYASKSKVMHTSLTCPAYTNVVVNFSGASSNPNQAEDTQITTIAVSPDTDFEGYYLDAVLVTGGLAGEYSLLNLNSALGEAPVKGFVTVAEEKETTHVHILNHRRTGALGAAFCSNDSKVRLLDINTNSWSAEFDYANQINCAATSPDGRLRMIVGDSCETLITDAERGDVLFHTRQHTGYGFACAWAADGWHVATGSEDGKVVVYDARRWDVPLAALACEMSCARSLHFSTSNRGGTSLVVAESDDIVSIYDAMNWQDKQTIDFFGSVVGAASVERGQELIVANGDATVGGLMVFGRKDYIPGQAISRHGGKQRSTRGDKAKSQRHNRLGLGFDDFML